MSTSSLFAKVEKVYDIGKCKKIHKLAKGYLNDVYILSTMSGKYILKNNKYRNSEKTLKSIISLLIYLKSRSFSCDYIISNKLNSYWLDFDQNKYTLHKFIQGENYSFTSNLNEKKILSAVQTLADYHKTVWNFVPDGEYPKANDLPLIFHKDIDWMINYITYYKTYFKNIVDYNYILAQIKKLDIFFQHEGFIELYKIPIHGDYRACNLIFCKDKVIGLIDWDLVQFVPRLVDVCGSLAVNSVLDSRNNFNFENFKNYILTYQKMAHNLGIPLIPLEIKAIPEIIRANLIQKGICLSFFFYEIPLRQGETFEERLTLISVCLERSIRLLRNFEISDWSSFVLDCFKIR